MGCYEMYTAGMDMETLIVCRDGDPFVLGCQW